jgi:hypothetical protein
MQAGSVRSAGTATGNPKASVKSIQGLVRRRDADILFSESKSDSDDDDDDDDVDQVAKGPIGSPDQGGNLGPEFDDEILAKPKRPFYKRRQFWVFAIMLSWTLLFVAVGVCFFKPSDDITKVQYWRICFFLAGLPLIWYTGDFVTIVIVWAVERSMFTVKNALYFAYAVRVSLFIDKMNINFLLDLFFLTSLFSLFLFFSAETSSRRDSCTFNFRLVAANYDSRLHWTTI